MNGSRWAIVDTETDGLWPPIHVVEIAAQVMHGWEPVGEPFRILLNHEVFIPPEAVAVHGYTQQYLREYGKDPIQAHLLFREFIGDIPIVAHNLSFDWNRCLKPEWERLEIQPFCRRGFCSMLLARRAIPEARRHRLPILKETFNLPESQSHRALNDVVTVVELFRRIFKPRLMSAGLDTFESVSAFSRLTPLRMCWQKIGGGVEKPPVPVL